MSSKLSKVASIITNTAKRMSSTSKPSSPLNGNDLSDIGDNTSSTHTFSTAQDAADVLTDSEPWSPGIIQNLPILTSSEKDLVRMLLSIQQHHLFDDWEEVGVNDDLKHEFFQQLERLNNSYPGGLTNYINNARNLLTSARNGDNPLEGYVPDVPTGVTLMPCTEKYFEYERIGFQELSKIGFVLVAGGLGERLGYSGVKIALPSETTTKTSYLELYCKSIIAIQRRYGDGITKLPLAIMTSDDTFVKTINLLERNNYFGLEVSQVTILKQEKVASLIDNVAHIAKASKYEIDTKPHGHGDVHSLMFTSGTASTWQQKGIKWIFFLQDTNGLAFYTLAAQLGVSVELNLEVNSMSIPRKAKQAIGAITKLVNEKDGTSMTINVEYNQLDPLLRATVSSDGDVNEESTGFSMYPGNINQLLFAMEPYTATLSATHGVMSEFVNPKYADKERSSFKKPTRLECMMQDYPKLLSTSAKVGFTMAPAWLCYSPCKNNTADAAIAVASGIPSASAFTAESDQYNVFSESLRLLGAKVDASTPVSILGVTATTELRQLCPKPANINISSTSTLVLDGNVILQSLTLNGALNVHAIEGTRIIVKTSRKKLSSPTSAIDNATNIEGICNAGQTINILEPKLFDALTIPEVDKMRGYILSMKQEELITSQAFLSQDSTIKEKEDVSNKMTEFVFNGRDLIIASAYEEDDTDTSLVCHNPCFPPRGFC